MSTSLTADDLAFLRRPLHGFLSVADGPVPPRPRPVWFDATDGGTVQLFTGPESPKVRQLERDRLGARYWDLDDPAHAGVLAAMRAEDQVRLVIHPDAVRRFAM